MLDELPNGVLYLAGLATAAAATVRGNCCPRCKHGIGQITWRSEVETGRRLVCGRCTWEGMKHVRT